MAVLYLLEEHRLKGKLKGRALVMMFLKLNHKPGLNHFLRAVRVCGFPHIPTLCVIVNIVKAADVALLKTAFLFTLAFSSTLLTPMLHVSL